MSEAVDNRAGEGVVLSLRSVDLDFYRRKGLLGSAPVSILSRIDLDLHKGETLGVIGLNGCGKSSLMRVLAGILAPTRGTISLHSGTTRAVLALGLGFRPELTGRDNALLSAMLQGCSREQAEGYLEAILQFSELKESFEQPVSTYSSGMRSRLGFSTALISQVDILFIDEVLAVGDASFRQKASAAIKEKIRGEQTVVLVSHNLQEVEELCDRVALIDAGNLMALGPTLEVTDQYRTLLHDLARARSG
ncbi:MAG: ABC transporter ATP-binding protein [Pseudomonadota bacterium]